MGGYADLLFSLPKSKRDVRTRSSMKTLENVALAKKFDKEYFDGSRATGYGGYEYDGRWRSVARDLIKFFDLKPGDRILDVGCGKGFLVYDLIKEGVPVDVYGIDISEYAIKNSPFSIRMKLRQGSADALPYEDKSFDLIISINTLHNLPKDRCIKALQEIERVSRGKSYIVVDSYYSHEQKREFEAWQLTAEFYDYPEGWIKLFRDAGYKGYYSWNIL